MTRFAMILALMIGFAACDQESADQASDTNGGSAVTNPVQVPMGKPSPCVTNKEGGLCEHASCTPDQQNGVNFSGCYVRGYNGVLIYTCGWEPSTNSCFQTIWCEESVLSVGLNDSGSRNWYSTEIEQVHLMPKGAVCNSGKASFAPGTLRVWGNKVPGSVTWPQVDKHSQWDQPNPGFTCVPNTHVVTVNC